MYSCRMAVVSLIIRACGISAIINAFCRAKTSLSCAYIYYGTVTIRVYSLVWPDNYNKLYDRFKKHAIICSIVRLPPLNLTWGCPVLSSNRVLAKQNFYSASICSVSSHLRPRRRMGYTNVLRMFLVFWFKAAAPINRSFPACKGQAMQICVLVLCSALGII